MFAILVAVAEGAASVADVENWLAAHPREIPADRLIVPSPAVTASTPASREANRWLWMT